MRLCRFEIADQPRIGFYDDAKGHVLDLLPLFELLGQAPTDNLQTATDLVDLLPIDSDSWKSIAQLSHHLGQLTDSQTKAVSVSLDDIQLLPPIGSPPKLLLLAGNYSAHVLEQGGTTAEQQETFPYVFMKPPSTTLIGSGRSFSIPKISPDKIDYELELAVVIGKSCSAVHAEDALDYVAGYTVVNDISDRGFRPNPKRRERPRDSHFDWSHGKWHPGSCPCGPCLVTPNNISNPQNLAMRLWIDGEIRQDARTSQQIFSVAQTIAFISSWMPLEPGDIISTGTPSGVGNATGRFLKPGQTVSAEIESIGKLVTPISKSASSVPRQ
jgi:2-keto-4-pentenoate hydratase/2-oxohepta-3-ene-1,7-dioic acid hydratase in catechol pathway